MSGNIVTIVGPSTAGKTSVQGQLVGLPDTGFVNIQSVTTRGFENRDRAASGGDYSVVSQTEFDAKLRAGDFLETGRYKNNSYGTPSAAVSSAITQGKVPVLVLEPAGVMQVQQWCQDQGINCNTVYLDIRPEVALLRLENRFQNEPGNTNQAVLTNYADRMAGMEKECQWSAEMADRGIVITQVIDSNNDAGEDPIFAIYESAVVIADYVENQQQELEVEQALGQSRGASPQISPTVEY